MYQRIAYGVPRVVRVFARLLQGLCVQVKRPGVVGLLGSRCQYLLQLVHALLQLLCCSSVATTRATRYTVTRAIHALSRRRYSGAIQALFRRYPGAIHALFTARYSRAIRALFTRYSRAIQAHSGAIQALLRLC